MIPFLQIFGWFCVLVIAGFILLWIWAEIIIKRGEKDKAKKNNLDAICTGDQKHKVKVEKGATSKMRNFQQPTKISDYKEPFVWHTEDGKLHLIATSCVLWRYPNCRIRFKDFDFNCVGKVFQPNTIIGSVVIESNRTTLVDTEFTFPITYDKAFSVRKVLMTFSPLTSHTPIQILEISTDISVAETPESKKTEQSLQIRAHDDKLIGPHPNTAITETLPLSSDEFIEDAPPMEFSDFFEWQKNGRTHTLIAKRSIFDKLGSGVSVVFSRRLLNRYPWPAPRIEGYNPGEVIDEISLYESYRRGTICKFNITLTEECVVLDRYFDYVRDAESTPFNIMRVSAGNGAIMLQEERLRREEENRVRMRKEAIEREAAEREAAERAEIEAKIKEKHRRKQLEKQVEADLIERGEIFKEARRPPIPKDVQDVVYNRDGGKCVLCGSAENLHFDHIIPFSKGGATNIENLQILCQKCNLEKSNKIG